MPKFRVGLRVGVVQIQKLVDQMTGPKVMTTLKKVPHPIDTHVGSRLRMQRIIAGVSQEKLGGLLGITFQQIQKYEKGSNRVSASRLQQIARLLDVPVSYFFQGAPTLSDASGDGSLKYPGPEVAEFISSSEGVRLARAFMKIKEATTRRRVIDLISAVAEPEGVEN